MRHTLLVLPILLIACGSTGGSSDAGTPIGADCGCAVIPDAGAPDAGQTPDSGGNPADAGPMFTLTLNNYLAWCSITEDGTALSPPMTTQSMSFPAGTVVDLTAAPLTGFVWGYWTGTDSASPDTNMSATVTMSADKTVLACCPDPPPASQTCP